MHLRLLVNKKEKKMKTFYGICFSSASYRQIKENK